VSTPPDSVNLELALNVAVSAARAAGAIQRAGFYSRDVGVIRKGAIDLLTEVDTACEAAVVKTIGAAFPEHRILAEEGGEMGGGPGGENRAASPSRWIIDPLDGTTNFAHRFPFFCVSIALEVAGEVQLGVVHAPMLDELFVARHGHGATLNGTPLAVSGVDKLVDAMLTTGFAYNVHSARRDNLDNFAAFTRRAQATRRTGSAALDLSCVAAGRFDGFWELNLKPWDTAAGALMVREAGGTLSRFDGSPHTLDGDETLASNGRIHAAMVAVLKAETG